MDPTPINRRFVVYLVAVSLGLGAAATGSVLVGTLDERAQAALERSRRLAAGHGLTDADLLEEPELRPLAIRSALTQGSYGESLRLIEGAGSRRPQYTAHEAAALLELGRVEEALAVWRPGGSVGAFERRLVQGLDRARAGVVLSVHDRRGRPVGTVDADGRFAAAVGVAPELVLSAALGDLAVAPGPGSLGLRLTIDLELSRRVQRALDGYRGSIVLLEPATGEVLAAVTDARTWAEGGNAAFGQRREPASIAKLITTSAALRAGIDVDAEIAGMRCSGSVRLDGEPLYCSGVHGRLRGLDHALAVSCNVAFARLGLMVGADRLGEEFARYGFVGPSTEIDTSGIFGRLLRTPSTERRLGDLAIGLEEAEITPVHAALLAAVMADGELPRPRTIRARDGMLGLSPRSLSPTGIEAAIGSVRLLDRHWLPIFHDSMLAVASYGTAARVGPPGFRVAMKTGTASELGRGFHVNYIGVAPVPEPDVAFSVRVTDQRTSRRVRRAAFQVTNRLLVSLEDWLAQPLPHDTEGRLQILTQASGPASGGRRMGYAEDQSARLEAAP